MASPRTRDHYIANFRILLTILVILHHTAICYGGVGSGVYTSRYHPPGSSAVLVAFNAVNQSFFMSAFMLMAGRFSVDAIRRKGGQNFVRDRIQRLGLPTVIYTLFGQALCLVVARCGSDGGSWADWRHVLQQYWRSIRGARGPSWFMATLLAFDLLFATVCFLADFIFRCLRSRSNVTRQHQRSDDKPPTSFGRTKSTNRSKSNIGVARGSENSRETGSASVPTSHEKMMTKSIEATQNSNMTLRFASLIWLLLVSLIELHTRLTWPIGTQLPLLGLNLGHAPAYVVAYILGMMTGWSVITIIPHPRARIPMIAVSLITSLYLGMQLARGPSNGNSKAIGHAAPPDVLSLINGGFNLTAAVYAVWNNTTGFLLGTGLLRFCIAYADYEIANGLIEKYAYSAFLVHYPVLAIIAVVVDEWQGNGVLKTLVVGTLTVAVSWLVGGIGSWIVGKEGKILIALSARPR